MGESPGDFSRQPLMVRLDFHVISIFCLHRALYKIHTWNLFGKIFARGKIKSVRKKKKKNKKESTILSRKEKKRKSFEKATGTSGAPRWHPDFEQRSRRQTKNCYT